VANYKTDSDKRGWGQILPDLLTGQATVINLARNGRSTKSFIAEGKWDKALAENGDYIFIQFGHNDTSNDPNRAADPNTEYPNNLRKYIADARIAGAVPVLVTPVSQRYFRADGTFKPTLEPFVAAMKKVAKETDTPLIDLHAASAELFQRLGDAGSADLSPNAEDRTHFSPKGAAAMADLVVQLLPRAVPAMKPYLKTGKRD
jgi:lysophospholipase L1-like esterase